MIARSFAAFACLTIFPGAAMSEVTARQLDYAELQGWADDDHAAALDAFMVTCGDLRDPDWARLCDLAKSGVAARDFFETFFHPLLIEDGAAAVFTGYYEPELQGSRVQQGEYQYPIYGRPDDLVEGRPYLTRRQIEEDLPLADRGLELAWLADPLDRYFLQIQGSGRIRLAQGGVMRVGFEARNGYGYSSVGQALIDRGLFEPHQVSARTIRDWVADNGAEGQALLWTNEAYVFFREVSEVPADAGPLGAMNRSITAGRSIAVDPAITPLGAPVWIEKNGADPMRRLMVAQDTGAAIKGAQRADIFVGTGQSAGETAGTYRDGGRMVVLLPIQIALDLVEGSPR